MSNHIAKTGGTEPQEMATQRSGTNRSVIIIGLVVGAYLLSYNYASAKTTGAVGGPVAGLAALATGGGGGGCCGAGGAPVEGAATTEGDVQKISVDTSTGSFSPNLIRVKAGVPIELAFSQAPGGCLSGVYFPDFKINEDLTSGGKTVKLPALEKGEYQFFCQMQMVSATIVVE